MIEQYSFGKIAIKGRMYTNDIKIICGRVVPDWWRKNGHRVEIHDIADILKENTDIFVLGKGKPGLMKSTDSLRKFLQKKEIELIEVSTPKAVDTFNKLLKEGKSVSAGFHLTC